MRPSASAMPPAAGIVACRSLAFARHDGARPLELARPCSATSAHVRRSRTVAGRPALRFSAARNSRGSGNCSHTCGRNVARCRRIRGSRRRSPGAGAATSVVLARAGERLARRRSSDTSIATSSRTRARRAARSAGRGTRRRSRSRGRPRRAAAARFDVPMQPRSSPPLRSVTNVAPGVVRATRGSAATAARAGRARSRDRRARDREQRVARASVVASSPASGSRTRTTRSRRRATRSPAVSPELRRSSSSGCEPAAPRDTAAAR